MFCFIFSDCNLVQFWSDGMACFTDGLPSHEIWFVFCYTLDFIKVLGAFEKVTTLLSHSDWNFCQSHIPIIDKKLKFPTVVMDFHSFLSSSINLHFMYI